MAPIDRKSLGPTAARLRRCAALLAALWSFSSAAQERPTLALTEDAFLTDLPVVLSVSRLAQPLPDAPAATTVIDRELIRLSGFRDIADLLRLAPGFNVGHASGNRPVVAYHGLSDGFPRALQVLVDGRSVYTPAIGGVNWDYLPLAIDDIERIEIIRGPNAVTYGANAFFGVVNIITRHPAQDQGTAATVVAGDHSQGELLLRHGGRVGNLDYHFTLGYRENNGFPDLPDTSRARLFTFRGDYSLGLTDQLQFQFGANSGPREQGTAGSRTDPPRPRDVTASFVQLRWQRTLSAGEEISLQYYYNYEDENERFPVPLPAPFQPLAVSFDKRATRSNLEFQHILSPRQDLRLVWGIEAREDRVNSQTFFNSPDDQTSRLARLFANGEWRATDRLVVNAGAMFEHYQDMGSQTSPRLFFNYQLDPDHTLRAGASRAYRVPQLFEERADVAFSQGPFILDRTYFNAHPLQPEKVNSREIGYLGRFLENRLVADLRLYRDDVYNLIFANLEALPPPGDLTDNRAFTFRQANPVRVQGLETQLRYRADNGFRLTLAHAAMRAKSANNVTPWAGSVPDSTLSALAAMPVAEDMQATVGYYRVRGLEWLGEGDVVPGYSRVDLGLHYAFRLGKSRGSLAAVVQNAFGGYNDFRNDVRIDRRAYLRASLEY